MNQPARAFCLLVGASLPLGLLALPWHESYSVRAAAAIVVTAMALWISEIAPLGVIGLLIPIAANALGLLTWKSALEAWGDPIIFQFLGAFLLARALEKHAIFEGLARLLVARSSSRSGTSSLVLLILVVAGAISSVQNNTAVAAMLLPVVIVIARRVPTPAIPLLALAYGATFGGLATPVGTAPNFIGYAAVQTLDPSFGFLSWMRVGVPAWLGTTLIGWMALQVTRGRTASGASERQSAGELASGGAATEGVVAADRPACRLSQRWTIALFALTALIWLGQGALVSILPGSTPPSSGCGAICRNRSSRSQPE